MMDDLYLRAIKRKPTEERSYVDAIPAIRHLTRLDFRTPVTFFVGENGSGKSTLLEAIAVANGFNPEGGTRNFNFATRETHSPLYRQLGLERGIHRPRDGFFFRAESFYNVATNIDELDEIPSASAHLIHSYGGKSLHEQSHGESFLALILNRLGGNGLYLFDEPEAALSPQNQLTFLAKMHDLVQNNSQILVATHSPILMAYPNAEIYQITPEGMEKTTYEDTPHYQITRSFLENPKRMLRFLMEDGDVKG